MELCCDDQKPITTDSEEIVCFSCGQVLKGIPLGTRDCDYPVGIASRNAKLVLLKRSLKSKDELRIKLDFILTELKMSLSNADGIWARFELISTTFGQMGRTLLVAVVYLTMRELKVAISPNTILAILQIKRSKFHRMLQIATKGLAIKLDPTETEAYIPQLIQALEQVADFDKAEVLKISQYLVDIASTAEIVNNPSSLAVACVACAYEAVEGLKIGKECLERLCGTTCCAFYTASSNLISIHKLILEECSGSDSFHNIPQKGKRLYASLYDMILWIVEDGGLAS
jgi:hypothetical protein